MSHSKKIVFITWGSFGDIHPFMGIARELQARGHRAAIATLSWYREKIELRVLSSISCGPTSSRLTKRRKMKCCGASWTCAMDHVM